jgi:hypothetical protein
MKIVALIYNFVVQKFFIWSHLRTQIIDILSKSDLDSISIVWLWRWLQMEKTLNYKVLDLVESYNFHVKFTSIWVQTKKITNFWKQIVPPIAGGHGGSSHYSTHARGNVSTAVGHNGRTPAAVPRRQMYSFVNFLADHLFLKQKKKVKRKSKNEHSLAGRACNTHTACCSRTVGPQRVSGGLFNCAPK